LFEKLSTTFTHPQATAEIRKIIEKQLGERETESGIVYVYRRPDCELLKISFTGGATTKPRMDSIKKVCRYDPEIVFEEATEHAKKVEFLVHRHLHKHRRREILISGACNGGKGCRHVHKEWFDVSMTLLVLWLVPGCAG
jgi:hypothetical protein